VCTDFILKLFCEIKIAFETPIECGAGLICYIKNRRLDWHILAAKNFAYQKYPYESCSLRCVQEQRRAAGGRGAPAKG
jgi:hypothetical protein